MSKIKRFSTILIILVLLFPAISAHDDAIRLSAFLSTLLSNDSPSDDSLTAVRQFPESGYDSALATLLERLETLHVREICTLHVETSSVPFHRMESSESHSRSVTAPVGRAPPAV